MQLTVDLNENSIDVERVAVAIMPSLQSPGVDCSELDAPMSDRFASDNDASVCPFCVKVRRAMKRQSLSIETRDVKRSETARGELLAGGGDLKVPCLRVEGGDGQLEWLYESGHIIGYLEDRFVAGSNVVGA